MKFNRMLSTLIIAASVTLANDANAYHVTEKYTIQDPQGKHYASQGILYHVNNARVAIANNKTALAIDHINYAINLNNFIENQGGNDVVENRVAVKKYAYSNKMMGMNVYFPDTTYASEWQKYNRSQYNESRKNLKMVSAPGTYALVVLDTNYIAYELEEAKLALSAGDLAEAEDDLEDIIENSLLVEMHD